LFQARQFFRVGPHDVLAAGKPSPVEIVVVNPIPPTTGTCTELLSEFSKPRLVFAEKILTAGSGNTEPTCQLCD
jgi:hypothetical protein